MTDVLDEIAGLLAGGYRFGVDGKRAADALRKFADQIESGKIAIQQARMIGVASNEDFLLRTLIVKFAERDEADALFGGKKS